MSKVWPAEHQQRDHVEMGMYVKGQKWKLCWVSRVVSQATQSLGEEVGLFQKKKWKWINANFLKLPTSPRL